MTTNIERWWARRAHRILTDQQHLDEVAAAGGSPDMDELDGSDLRWPGYFGRRYGQGLRVLAVANVHRGFRSYAFDPGPPRRGRPRYRPGYGRARDNAVGATRSLKTIGLVDDAAADAYLADVRPMYELGMSGKWSVGHAFASAWQAVGIEKSPRGMETMAYVNVSCCQIPEDDKLPRDSDVKTAIKEACTANHPLAGGDPATDLVAALDPQVIIVSAKEAWEYLRDSGVSGEVLVVPFHQRKWNHELLAPVEFGGLSLPGGLGKDFWRDEVNRYLKSKGLLD